MSSNKPEHETVDEDSDKVKQLPLVSAVRNSIATGNSYTRIKFIIMDMHTARLPEDVM